MGGGGALRPEPPMLRPAAEQVLLARMDAIQKVTGRAVENMGEKGRLTVSNLEQGRIEE